MKLLKAFRDQIRDIGPIRRAWFTTFGLDLELLERYVVPALVGADVPRNLSDYEQVQAHAFPDDHDKPPVDIRVFYDARVGTSDKIKRTSIPLYPVDFRLAALMKKEDVLRGGFFHPKVIYLEGDKGSVIGAGSANLTIKGWGRNREVFHFEKLRGHDNRQEVTTFFKRVHIWCGMKDDFEMPPVQRDERNPQNWRFVASTGQTSFLDLLTKGIDLDQKSPKQLTVFSPYLAENLAGLANQMDSRHQTGTLTVVGDRNPDGRIRLSPEAARDFLAQGHALQQDADFDHTNTVSHAKVWVTPRNVAIGSWNLTGPATGLLSKKHNVEAGFVFFGKGGEVEGLTPLDLQNGLHSAEKLLQDAELFEIETRPPPVPVIVRFDWRTRIWDWDLPELFRTAHLSPRLHLPRGDEGMHEVDLVAEGTGQVTVTSLSFLLRSRTVQATYLENGHRHGWPVWIQELNPQERPIARFDSLDDMLTALIQGRPETGMGLVSLEGEPEAQVESSVEGRPSVETPTIGSTFRIFAALKMARRTLEQAETTIALRRRVQVYPGCVTEIVERLRELCDQDGITLVRRWFIVQELRSLVRAAKTRWTDLATQDDVAPDFDAIRRRIPVLPPLEKDPEFGKLARFAARSGGYR